MKRSFLQVKVIVAFWFVFLCSGLIMAENKPVKRHNWENGMGPLEPDAIAMCVNLTNDYMLNIKLHLDVYEDNVSSNVPIHFKYVLKVNGVIVQTGVTGQVTNSMLVHVANGAPNHYSATFSVPYNCKAICESTYEAPGGMFNFDLEYILVTPSSTVGTFTPYPLDDYPSTWPPTVFEIPASGFDEWAYDSKKICCPSLKIMSPDNEDVLEAANSESIQQSHKTSSYTDLFQMEDEAISNPGFVGQLQIIPNPFDQLAKVQFNLNQPGTVEFACLDIQGRLVKSFTAHYQTAGQQETQLDMSNISSGLYYLRMATQSGIQMTKMVKTSD